MHSLLLLNTPAFPSIDTATLTQFLSQTLPGVSIHSPITHLEVTTAIQRAEPTTTLFLILNNKKKNIEMEHIAYQLTQRQRVFWVYYLPLESYEGRTVQTYDEIISKVRGEFKGQRGSIRVPNGERSNQVLVMSVQSISIPFRTLMKSLRSKMQQQNPWKVKFEQNYNFSSYQIFNEYNQCILIINDQEMYRNEESYTQLINRIQKNKLVTIVFSLSATIPYGFRFDQLVTNFEELAAKTQWFIKEHYKLINLPQRHSTIMHSSGSGIKRHSIQSQLGRSPVHKRTSIIHKQNVEPWEQSNDVRRKSVHSQARRESRISRLSQREEDIQLNFNWVCKKKPSGFFVTIPEAEYRKHGIRKTFYGNEGSILQTKRSSIDDRHSSILKSKRSSMDSRHSSLLKSELESLENKLKHPALSTQKDPIRQQQIEPTLPNSEQTSKIQPRRHSSTAGYNELNLQQLLLFQQSLPPTSSIPSTMSFGSLQSSSKQFNVEESKRLPPSQHIYYNNNQLDNLPKNSPKLRAPQNSHQPNTQRMNSPNPLSLSDNKSIIRSSDSRSKPRMSTLRFRIPTIYIPSSHPNLRYLINVTYPSQFSLIQYRNLPQLQELIENLDGSMRPTVIFDQYNANEAMKIIDFSKESYIHPIIYSPKGSPSKTNGRMSLATTDQALLLEVDRIER